MGLTEDEALQLLEQLQLTEEEEARYRMLAAAGNPAEFYRFLRCLRCGFLEEMHDCQKRLEQLDFLIYQTKKEMGE